MGKLLSVKEVAGILGLHEAVIRRYIRSGILSAVRLEGAYRIDEKDLNNWLEKRKTGKQGER
jgi:excisionase family DNA binding protein